MAYFERSISKYDLVNMHGAELCHAYGCRKHVRLVDYAGGKWCRKHLPRIMELRQIIQPHNNTPIELEARLEELILRKNADERHYYYARRVERVYYG
jgi:hypothetical protein